MTPTAETPQTNLVVSHPDTLSGSDVLNVVNSIVQTDAPVVVEAIPSTSPKVSLYVALGQLGLGIANQIVQAIHAAHQAKSAQ